MDQGRGRDGVDRRTLLGGLGALSSVGLAGCFDGSSPDGGSGGGDGSGGGGDGDADTVRVGPGGKYTFDPEELTVSTGATVTWSWESANHNVVVENQPDVANWRGTNGDASTTYDDGYKYEFTFEVAGTYEYYCQPHESLGMRARVVVEE